MRANAQGFSLWVRQSVHGRIHHTRLHGVLVLSVLLPAVSLWGADLPKTGRLRFERIRLVNNFNEGCAIADINNDGRLDVIAGPAWYENPTWRQRAIRHVGVARGVYMENNGDHTIDLNGDGWVDVIAGSWFSDKVYWYENPGAKGLAAETLWDRHLIVTGWEQCEGTLLEDLDGDGVGELLMNTWSANAMIRGVRITLGQDGQPPRFREFEIGIQPYGHGLGVGDVNGDGRVDVMGPFGWFEAPASDPFGQKWTLHPEAFVRHCSLPCIVADVNGDGRNDILMGHGHDYGLLWLEQGSVQNSALTWTTHEIDRSWSQVHCLTWADLDGDGKNELITGKRYHGHAGKDPGAEDPVCLFRYVWDASAGAFERDVISYNNGVGGGMQIRTGDLNGDGRLDLAVAGKTGTYVLLNCGPAKATPSAN